jgi:retron-type reverse transcriptase
VVDIDLEKFFDRVNHDILMGLVAKRVTDKRILKLIRGFLTAGALARISHTIFARSSRFARRFVRFSAGALLCGVG